MAETSDIDRSPVTAISARSAAMAASAVLVLTLAASLHVIPYGRAVWDFIFVLDGSYRIGLGQVPHVDFASPIGPLTLYLTYLAERLFPGGQPFVGLHALAWLVVLPPFAALTRRLSSGWAFAASFAILALVVLAPYTLDATNLSEISYFGVYNRFATGMLFLAGLWFVLPKARGDGVLLGYLFTVLLFLKVTAAISMLGIVVAAVLIGRACPAVLLTMLIIAVAVAALIQMATGLVSGYLHDLAAMSAINGGRSLYLVSSTLVRNWLPLAVTLTIVILAALELDFASALRRPVAFARRSFARESFAIDAAQLVAAALAAESQNTGGVGLIAAAAALFNPALTDARRWRRTAAAVLGATLVLPLADIAVKRAVTALVRERQGTTDHDFATLFPGMRVPVATLDGARLMTRLEREWSPLLDSVEADGFNLDNDPASASPASRAAWATGVAEAAASFQRLGYAAKARNYATIAFADPFPRLLGLTPARGTSLVIDGNRTVPRFSPAQASAYLAAADGVFFGSCELRGAGDSNPETFRAVLDREFIRWPLHPCWDFYSRTH